MAKKNNPGCNCCGCGVECTGTEYEDPFDSLDVNWDVDRSNFSIAVTSGKLECTRDSQGVPIRTGTAIYRTFADGVPTRIVVKCDVFEVPTNGELAGIGWDFIAGSFKQYHWQLTINWILANWSLTHDDTVVSSGSFTTSSSHTLAFEITDIGGGEVESIFCVDDVQVGETYTDTYTLSNNTKYGLIAEAEGTPTGVVVAKYDNFCTDVDYIVEAEGDAAQTPPTSTQALLGQVLLQGDINQTAVSGFQALLGKLVVSGDINQTSASPTQTAAGKLIINGNINQTSASPTQEATGDVVISGDIDQTAADETQALEGTVGTPCGDLDCVFECQAGGWFIQSDGCAVEPGCECPDLPTDPCEMENFGETQNQPCQDI